VAQAWPKQEQPAVISLPPDAQEPLQRKGFWFVTPTGFEPELSPREEGPRVSAATR